MSAPKEDNANNRKTRVDFDPLLEGNIQIVKLGTMHKKYATNELRLCNVFSLSTDRIRMLDSKIKESECPEWSDLEKDMNEEQKNRLTFFSPRFLTAQQWDKDCILSSNYS